jgi:hypothetical protein
VGFGIDREAGSWLNAWRFAGVLGLFVLAAFPQVLLGMQTFVYRDFGFFGYPLAYYFRTSVAHGQLPLWNPLNECGLPFLAQWNTQVLYPPAWLCLALPLSWAVGVICVAHLFCGGLGMFVLARKWTRDPLAAAVAGIVFSFSGLMVNSLIWPNNIAALGLMPWVVLVAENAWRCGGRWVVGAGVVGAIQMLSGAPEVILLTWILVLSLALMDGLGPGGTPGRALLRTLLVVLAVGGLSAVQLLPFLDLLRHSHRGVGFIADQWAMPPTGWANFFVPLFHCRPGMHGVFVQEGQAWTASYYLGIAAVVLASRAAALGRDRRVWVLAVLSVLFLVLAFGDAGILYAWLRQHVGAVSFMRFPIKFIVLPVFAVPLLAAFAIAHLRGSGGWSGKGIAASWLVVMLLLAGIVWHAADSPQSNGDWKVVLHNAIPRAAFFTAIFVVLWLAGARTGPKLRGWLEAVLLLLVWVDLWTHAPMHQTVAPGLFAPGMAREVPPPRFGDSRAMVSARARGRLQFLSTSDPGVDYIGRRAALFSNCNLLDDVPVLHGFFSLHLPEHLDVGALLYADTTNASPRLAEFVGVSQVTSATNDFEWVPAQDALPLITGGQRPVFADAGARLREMASPGWDPRQEVFLDPADRAFVTVTNRAHVEITGRRVSAQRLSFQVQADASALVVVAQSFYHNWRVYVDDKPARLLRANHAFQAFEVSKGTHDAVLVYEDSALRAGAAISLFTVCACAVGCLRKRKPTNREVDKG